MANSSDLRGRVVLVVEDEAMIAMFMEDALLEAGCRRVVRAGTLSQAAEAAQDPAIELAILDINLAGVPSLPVAESLAARGVPLVFVSGYGPSALKDYKIEATVLGKPFGAEALCAAAGEALGKARPAR